MSQRPGVGPLIGTSGRESALAGTGVFASGTPVASHGTYLLLAAEFQTSPAGR